MKVEKARITIVKDSLTPAQNVLFIDCEFSIEVSAGDLTFINCYFEGCRFDKSFQLLCDITLGGYYEGNCAFAETAEQGALP